MEMVRSFSQGFTMQQADTGSSSVNNIITQCARFAGTNPLVKATFEQLGFQVSVSSSLIDYLADLCKVQLT